MTDDPASPHHRLAARLRDLRGTTTQAALAARLGWTGTTQTKVSKIETGRQAPTVGEVAAWAAATDPTTATDLEALRAAAEREATSWRTVTRRQRGLADYQAGLAAAESAATHVDEYQPAMLPGYVHTPELAAEMLSLPPGPVGGAGPLTAEQIGELLPERMRRGDLLYRPGRRIRLVVGEAALWAAPGSVDTLRGQLGKLLTVAELPTVTLGVVPLRTMPTMPLSGFRIYDARVAIETLRGEEIIDDPSEVAGFVRAFDGLLEAARTGADAVSVIRAVIESLA